MEHGNIVGMFGGCHRSSGFIGGAIMVATTWPWRWFKPSKVSSHSSIGFIYSDGYREIFEAREGKSWQGPIPVDKVERWVAENKKRRFTMYDIPDNMISIESMSRKYLRCEAMLTVWTYSMMQLPRMGIRHFIPFLPMKPTPNKVVCSEAATIILGPDVDICRMTGKFSPDRVTPYDYEAALKLLTAKPKHQPADTKDAYNVG
jgi:hypothetical protein